MILSCYSILLRHNILHALHVVVLVFHEGRHARVQIFDLLLTTLVVLDHLGIHVVKLLLRFVAEELLIPMIDKGNTRIDIVCFTGGYVLAIIHDIIANKCGMLLLCGRHLSITYTTT